MAGTTVGKLNALLTADTSQFNVSLDKADKRTSDFSKSLKTSGSALIAGFTIKSAIDEVKEFQEAFAQSTAIMGNLDMATRKQLVDTANEVAFTTKFSATEAAKAY